MSFRPYPALALALACAPLASSAASASAAPERIVFSQDFSAASTLAAYLGGDADKFDVIGAVDGGEAAVAYGALALSKGANGKGSAFAVRLSPLGLARPALRVSCDITVSPDWQGSAGNALVLVLGDELKRNANNAAPGRFAQLHVALDKSPVCWLLEPVTRVTSRRLVADTPLRLAWFINGTDSPVSYTGPDRAIYQLASHTMDAWIGTDRALPALAVQDPARAPRQLSIGLGGSGLTHTSFLIDNLVIAELTP
jgi:hypothetical protein